MRVTACAAWYPMGAARGNLFDTGICNVSVDADNTAKGWFESNIPHYYLFDARAVAAAK